MQILRTAAVAVATAVALSADIVRGGTVTFYQHADFKGVKFPVSVSQTQRCFNIGCFNDRASSIVWNDLPVSGKYCYRPSLGPMDFRPITSADCQYSAIAVYSDANCEGDIDWWVTKSNSYPSYLYSLNDRVSSFMIWEKDTWASNGVQLVCPFSRRLEEGNSTTTLPSRDNNLRTVASEQPDMN